MTRILSSALLIACLAACSRTSEDGTGAAGPAADTVLHHGRIYTLDPAQEWAEAVAVSGGTLVSVGDDAGASAYIGGATDVIDLEGRMVMPGINDAHMHPIGGEILSLYYCQFPITSGPGEVSAFRSATASP